MESTRPVYVQRFLLDDSAVEEVEDYAPGGLHPTHLGDLLGEDGRYKVVLKLGHGGFGMVWLCRDTQRSKWKAVKILRASDSTEDCADLRIHSVFSDMDSQHTDIGHSRVAFALDHFWMEGPNGRHLCIVMPLLGPNLDNAARRYLYEEAPLMRICYQLVQAISFLHAKGVCHGDFRPQNACFTLKDIDDLEEEDIIRAFGRPKLVCLVDDGEFEWEDGSNGGAVEFNDEVYDVDDSDEQPEARPPRYLVSKSYLNPDSPFVSNNIAVIDFGESFLASEPPESTGIPCHYGAPETFIDKCGDLGFSSDLWALGCTICHVRVGSDPFFDVGDIWYLMSYWENLNGPLPEPYRSSLAEDFEVPEDLDQYVSTDLEEMEELKQEYLRRTGVTGSLHNILLIERRFHVLLQEGEEPSPPPPPTSSTRGQMREEPGHKIVAVEMSRREASQLLDLLKQTFAWQPSDRIPAAEILSLPWFAAYHEEEKQVSGSQPGAAVAGLPDEDDDIRATVPYCGMTPLFALLRGFLRLYIGAANTASEIDKTKQASQHYKMLSQSVTTLLTLLSGITAATSLSRQAKTCTVKSGGSNATDDAPAIIEAFRECGQDAMVVFDPTTYHVNSVMNITWLQNVKIDLQGTLSWGTNISYWLNHSMPVGYQNQSTAFILGGDGITLEGHGHGTFNGNGDDWYRFIREQPNTSNYPGRPHAITFNGLTNSVVRGVSFLRSQMWTMSIIHSHNNTFDSIFINNTGNSVQSSNTDGADTFFSSNIRFNNWTVYNGDDSISMKANSTDISVTNSKFYNGLGIALGSIGQYKGAFETIERLHFENISYFNTLHAVYVKTWTNDQNGYPPNGGGGGLGFASNVTAKSIEMQGMRGGAFTISQCTRFSGAPGTGNCTNSQFQVRGLEVRGARGTTKNKNVASFQCSAVAPCTDIGLYDIDVGFSNGTAAPDYLCGNVVNPLGFECTGPPCVGGSATGGC